MFKIRTFSAFDILKIPTLALLAGLLVFLGSATRSTSAFAYVALTTIVLLQMFEVLAPGHGRRIGVYGNRSSPETG